MIFFISLIELNKLYVNQNTKENIFQKFYINEDTKIQYLSELEKFQNSSMSKLKICNGLMNKNMDQLIECFNFEDIKFYFVVNRIFIKKKFQPKFFSVFKNQRKIEIEYNHKIKDIIICSKIKRRDEILKFSYKFELL